MKNLNEYPTPITDELCENLSNSDHDDWEKWQLTASKCADMERKNAACRVALEESQECLVDANFSKSGYILTLVRETLSKTNP